MFSTPYRIMEGSRQQLHFCLRRNITTSQQQIHQTDFGSLLFLHCLSYQYQQPRNFIAKNVVSMYV